MGISKLTGETTVDDPVGSQLQMKDGPFMKRSISLSPRWLQNQLFDHYNYKPVENKKSSKSKSFWLKFFSKKKRSIQDGGERLQEIVEQKLASCVLISLASLKQKWLSNVQEHCKPGAENSLDCLLVRTNIEKLTRKHFEGCLAKTYRGNFG